MFSTHDNFYACKIVSKQVKETNRNRKKLMGHVIISFGTTSNLNMFHQQLGNTRKVHLH